MSSHIIFDSSFRDRTQFPNPARFDIGTEMTAGWSSLNKIVQCVKPCAKKDACNLLYCIKLLSLTIPLAATNAAGGTPLPNVEPFLFVRLSTTRYNDHDQIKSAFARYRNATFLCNFVRNQGGADQWQQYASPMNQCIRLDDKAPELFFNVFTREGSPEIPLTAGIANNTIIIADNALPAAINPTVQVTALFEITPYVRDGDYDNHVVSLWQDN